ncbi:unnamed protein product [Cercospora beticola]|nr:unnamed protein product [Cercospora beticola]
MWKFGYNQEIPTYGNGTFGVTHSWAYENEMYLHCAVLSTSIIASLTRQEFAWNATPFELAIRHFVTLSTFAICSNLDLRALELGNCSGPSELALRDDKDKNDVVADRHVSPTYVGPFIPTTTNKSHAPFVVSY